MATILVIGKNHIKTAKTPIFSKHKLISGGGRQTFFVRMVFNKRLGLSTNGIAPLGRISEHFDLIHCLNHIPITNKPWIITFEDIIPRTFGPGGKKVSKIIRHRLLKNNCIKLVGQSNYALKKLARTHSTWNRLPQLMQKTTVIHPSIEYVPRKPKHFNSGNLNLVFCGSSFARKGGVSAVRLAKKAYDSGFPLTMHIVSDLKLNAYTDFMDVSRYDNDLKLLKLPNVVFHSRLSNEKVLALLADCHFQFMPTLADTFGFSVIEGFSVGTPAIVTNTCALPEFVHHQKTGYLLDTEVNGDNDITWLRPAHDIEYRLTDFYWEKLDNAYTQFAEQAYAILDNFLQNPADYESLSANALSHVESHHNAKVMSVQYDQLYDQALKM